ncbi:MAG TPA: hypothetical protein VMY37_31700 [Thermoguttaceae bacterium]|nr:hypothetical protein [Thermoguttaceae bacterium]
MNTIRCACLALAWIVVSIQLCSSATAAVIGYTVWSYEADVNPEFRLYEINMNTGAATDLGVVAAFDPEGMAFVGNQLYAMATGVGNWELWNITTCPGTWIGNIKSQGLDAGLDYHPVRKKLYAIFGSLPRSYLVEIDPVSGIATSIGSADGKYGDGLAINKDGQAFASDFVGDNDGQPDGLYSVNLDTGEMDFIGDFLLGDVNLQSGLAFDSDDALWAITSIGDVYAIDTTTGRATWISQVNTLNGGRNGEFQGLAIPKTNEIPEPSMLTVAGGMLLCGMIGLRYTQKHGRPRRSRREAR